MLSHMKVIRFIGRTLRSLRKVNRFRTARRSLSAKLPNLLVAYCLRKVIRFIAAGLAYQIYNCTARSLRKVTRFKTAQRGLSENLSDLKPHSEVSPERSDLLTVHRSLGF